MKERIQQKAEDLFRRYGIRSVTMDEIASQLGISKKTIYQFYADKEEVVAAVFEKMLGQNRDRCMADKKLAHDPVHEMFLAIDMIQQVFRNLNPSVLFDLMKYHPNVYEKINQFKYSFLYQVISANLLSGIEKGLYRPEINVDVLTRFRIESVMIAFNSSVFPDNGAHLMEIEEEIFELFLHGIVTAKGQKLAEKYKKQRQPKNAHI